MVKLIDTYRIDLPPGWLEMSTDPAEIRQAYRDVRDPAAWEALSTTERRRAEMYVERFIADLQQGNISMAALYREIVADGDIVEPTDRPEGPELERGAEGDGLLIASCVVSLLSMEGGPLPEAPDADTLLAALSLDRPLSDEDRARLGTALEPPRLVEVAAGTAVRTSRLLEPDFPGIEAKVFAATYYLPVPDASSLVMVTQFTTPNRADAPVFAELFDAIIQTLRFYAADQPTEL